MVVNYKWIPPSPPWYTEENKRVVVVGTLFCLLTVAWAVGWAWLMIRADYVWWMIGLGVVCWFVTTMVVCVFTNTVLEDLDNDFYYRWGHVIAKYEDKRRALTFFQENPDKIVQVPPRKRTIFIESGQTDFVAFPWMTFIENGPRGGPRVLWSEKQWKTPEEALENLRSIVACHHQRNGYVCLGNHNRLLQDLDLQTKYWQTVFDADMHKAFDSKNEVIWESF